VLLHCQTINRPSRTRRQAQVLLAASAACTANRNQQRVHARPWVPTPAAMAEHGAAELDSERGIRRPDCEPRRVRSRSPPQLGVLGAQTARHLVRNVGILRGGTASLMATLNVVNARVDKLDRNVRALCDDTSREALPANYSQNVTNAMTQARECCKLLEAMHVAFGMVTEGIL